jgi:hypothetical protein
MRDSIGTDSLWGAGRCRGPIRHEDASYCLSALIRFGERDDAEGLFDMRTRLIARVESGASRREAAEHYEVSASTAVTWVKCFRESGRCAAKPRWRNSCLTTELTRRSGADRLLMIPAALHGLALRHRVNKGMSGSSPNSSVADLN